MKFDWDKLESYLEAVAMFCFLFISFSYTLLITAEGYPSIVVLYSFGLFVLVKRLIYFKEQDKQKRLCVCVQELIKEQEKDDKL